MKFPFRREQNPSEMKLRSDPQASVGIAMRTGTDVAIESAEITLLNSDIRSVLTAFNLSRATLGYLIQ